MPALGGDAARPDRRRDRRGVGRPDDAARRRSATSTCSSSALVPPAWPPRCTRRPRVSHPRRRARVDRRPGRVQLADPQLPRLLARGQRRGARAARLPAGVGVRRALPADARGRPALARTATGSSPTSPASARCGPGRWCSRPASPTGGSASPALEALSGTGVYYGANVSEAHALTGLHAVVVGGGNSAGQAALHLARYCEQVTLVVRGATSQTTMSSYLVDAIEAAPRSSVRTAAEVIAGGGRAGSSASPCGTARRRRGAASARRAVRDDRRAAADRWLPDEFERDGSASCSPGADASRTGWPGCGAPQPYETSAPGIFAVGDVRCGSVKRVASAVGEGSVVVSQLHAVLSAGRTWLSRAVHLPPAALAVAVGAALPLVGLALLLARPALDVPWEHHPSHFWLVLGTAALSALLAYATGVGRDPARRRTGPAGLAGVPVVGRVPRPARAGDTGRAAPDAEPRLRPRHSRRPRARVRARCRVRGRPRRRGARGPPAGGAGPAGLLVLMRGLGGGVAGAAAAAARRGHRGRRRLARAGRPVGRCCTPWPRCATCGCGCAVPSLMLCR